MGDNLSNATMQNSSNENSWQSNMYYGFGVLGYSLYLALILFILIDSDLLLSGNAIEQSSFVAHAVFIVSFVIMLSIVGFFSDVFSKRFGAYTLTATSLLVALPIFSSVLNSSASLISFAGGGVGAASLLLLSAPFFSSLNHRKLFFFLSISFAFAVFIAIGLPFFPKYARIIFLSLMILASVSFASIARHTTMEYVPVVLSEESKKHDKSSWKSNAAALGNSICIGFMLYSVSSYITFEWRFLLIGSIAIATALVMAIDTYKMNILSDEALQLKYFLPCVMLGFLPILFFGEIGCLIGCAVLSIVFTAQFITNMGAIAENVFLFKLSSIRYFSFSRIGNMLGLFFGYFFGFAAFGSFIETSIPPTSILFTMVAILVFLATLFYQDRYPSIPNEKKLSTKKGIWMRKCDVLAERSKLTQREHEILLYLAKGHDKEFIQSKLYVSQSTIKSHIYSIYQKNGIHSRKELIALIESVELQD